jgi:hypothetical protein
VFASLEITFDQSSVTRLIWKASIHPLEISFIRPSSGCCAGDVQTEFYFYGKVNITLENDNLTLAPVNFGYYDLDIGGSKDWIKVQSGGISNIKVY